ncbi:epimerase family protein SDR39U1-like [Clavelina lepadiformis]|uniref:epimerase family protein SDR39U1-like n=1 Tax=Clavelina lepadiformis TaxID=159417 RepID=UPI0040436939
MQRTVVIGGGTGFIGRSLCVAVEKLGYKAVSVSRNSGDRRNVITWEEIKKNGLPNDTVAVINLAGEPVLNPMKRWNKTFEDEIYKSRINTTRLLKNSVVEAEKRPKLWATTSAIGFYPCDNTRQYDEDSIPETKDYWSKFVSAWEDASVLPDDVKGVRHCIVRTGIVLGKNGGVIQNLKPSYWLGFGGPISDGKQYFPWIHIDDIVGIFTHILTNDDVIGVLNGVAPAITTNKEFSQCFASNLNRPAILCLPAIAVNAIFGSVRASMLLEGQCVTPKRTLRTGYKFIYPQLDDALKQIVS